MSGDQRVDLSFPLRLDNRGRLATSNYARHIGELIEQVLFTRPGERVNRPDFGTPIPGAVFDSATPELMTQLQYMVQTSLHRFMDGAISVENVAVVQVENRIEITINYTILVLDQSFEQTFQS